MPTLTRLSSLAALLLVASCSSGTSSGSPSPRSGHSSASHRSSSASRPSPPKPSRFTSKAYGYTLTVPAPWIARQAFAKWDGEAGLNGDSAEVDLFGQPSETKGVWAAAVPSKRDLAAAAAYAIVWTAHVHGDTCPPLPSTRSRITVGGQPGVLLAYNCGILVNTAVTVYRAVEYWFVFVDRGLAAATNAADQATFTRMLNSVQFKT
jgi:hypothetical protein